MHKSASSASDAQFPATALSITASTRIIQIFLQRNNDLWVDGNWFRIEESFRVPKYVTVRKLNSATNFILSVMGVV